MTVHDISSDGDQDFIVMEPVAELYVAPQRLVSHLGETSGSIWMVEWKTR